MVSRVAIHLTNLFTPDIKQRNIVRANIERGQSHRSIASSVRSRTTRRNTVRTTMRTTSAYNKSTTLRTR